MWGLNMVGRRDISQINNYAFGSLLQTEISAMKKSDKESGNYIKRKEDII